MSRKLTRKEKEEAGLTKPPLSKFEAKRAAERAAAKEAKADDSPFAILRALDGRAS